MISAEQAWEDCFFWQRTDPGITGRTRDLIKDRIRHPFEGIGKPEPLRHALTGLLAASLVLLGGCRPAPMDSSEHGVEYSDKTVVFDDRGGLPKSVELLASDGTLLCSYHVLKATNILGRTIPLQFQLVKWRQGPSPNSQSYVHGSVRLIKRGTPPELPAEMPKSEQP